MPRPTAVGRAPPSAWPSLIIGWLESRRQSRRESSSTRSTDDVSQRLRGYTAMAIPRLHLDMAIFRSGMRPVSWPRTGPWRPNGLNMTVLAWPKSAQMRSRLANEVKYGQ